MDARGVLLAALALTLAGCSGWSWRVPGLRYGPTEAPATVAGGGLDVELGLEAYPVAVWEGSAGTWDQVQQRLQEEGRRRGGHAVLLEDWQATVAHTTMVHTPRETDAGIVSRKESVEQQSSEVSVRALAMRRPEQCLGLQLQCVDLDCGRVVVQRVHLGSPAEAAGLVAGDWVLRVDGEAVAHPWDVHQRSDRVEAVSVGVMRDEGDVDVPVTPAPCGQVYGAATR